MKETYKKIWIAIFLAPVVYYAIGVKMSSSGTVIAELSEENGHLVGVILAAVGAIHLILGVLRFRFVLPEEKLKRSKSGPAVTALVFGVALVAAAFIESPSLLALVWTLLSRDSTVLLPAVLLSMGALYYSRGKALEAFEYVEKKEWPAGKEEDR